MKKGFSLWITGGRRYSKRSSRTSKKFFLRSLNNYLIYTYRVVPVETSIATTTAILVSETVMEAMSQDLFNQYHLFLSCWFPLVLSKLERNGMELSTEFCHYFWFLIFEFQLLLPLVPSLQSQSQCRVVYHCLLINL